MKKIAMFASGSGSNVQNIAEYFQKSTDVQIDCILTNNSKAFVLERAKSLHIEAFIFTKEEFYQSNQITGLLNKRKIDLIVLAGFLWLIPQNFIKTYSNKIINIHPALLPKYGGKGMYGMLVHQKIIENNEPESGITIHYVNENYDEGNIIYQAKCQIEKDETPESLATKIHQLEYLHYPRIINEIALKS